jgi:hypothetical protein
MSATASLARASAPTTALVVKTCSCGRQYTAVTWAELPPCGTWEDDVECLELRTCSCGSTIAVVVAGGGASSAGASAAGVKVHERR